MGRECSFCVVVVALALGLQFYKREINESPKLGLAEGHGDKSSALDFFARVG